MSDEFVIHGIDPITGSVSVTFTINGSIYPQVFSDIPVDSLDNLNQVLADKLALIKTKNSLNDVSRGKRFAVETDNTGKVTSISQITKPAQVEKIDATSEVIQA